ncbi:hypothetical protein FA95DRAFT_1553014 [Auriscalpium vulgare]|uniref:Uncharacterized protein n=1 Tax=Auriscalpium vulgare TaxID=40419 RepID=A0ACB8SA26_9AGAM|nr:hypothetical protein FA95DRAFT_1553014 [Auriscalpium vulgare]
MGSRTRGRIKVSSDAAFLALEALRESADVFPPLKSAVGGLMFLLSISRTLSSNKDEARHIADRVDHISALLEHAVPDATNISAPVRIAIDVFDRSLHRINEEVSDICMTGRAIRIIHGRKTEARLQRFHRQLDEAIVAFIMAVSVSLEQRSTQTEVKLDAVHLGMDNHFNALQVRIREESVSTQKSIVFFTCPSAAVRSVPGQQW